MKSKKTWISLLVSLVFLYLAFRDSDWSGIWNVVRDLNYLYLAAAQPFLLLTFLFRAIRWDFLLMPTRKGRLHTLFSTILIGFMANNVLPLRLGEFVRAYVIGRREKVSVSASFATIVVERVFDGCTVILFMAVALLYSPFHLDPQTMAWVRTMSAFGILVYIAAIVFLVFVKIKIDLVIAVVEFMFGWSPRVNQYLKKILQSFAIGLQSLGSSVLLLKVGFHSIMVWLAAAGYYYVTMLAFTNAPGGSWGPETGFIGIMFLLSSIALGVMVPAGPGFVGTFQFACIIALTALGVDKTTAESYSIIAHAAQYVPVTATGIVYLYLYNMRFSEIKTADQSSPPH